MKRGRDIQILLLWLMLITIGFALVASALLKAPYYTKDYFDSNEFAEEMDDFWGYFYLYEIIETNKAELLANLEVTEDEINEHRYRYGTLAEQVANIHAQYEEQIQLARLEENEDLAQFYENERDEKIKDITLNFESDEHVKKKILKEKEARFDELFQRLERDRTLYDNYKQSIYYVLKDRNTEKTFWNLSSDQTWEEMKEDERFLYETSVKGTEDDHPVMPETYRFEHHFYDFLHGDYVMDDEYVDMDYYLEALTGDLSYPILEGKLAIASEREGNRFVSNYEYYQSQQQRMIYEGGIGFVLLLAGLWFSLKKAPFRALRGGIFERAYQKLPIDLRYSAFLITLFIDLAFLFTFAQEGQFAYTYTIEHVIVIGCLIFLAFVTFSQLVLLLDVVKDPDVHSAEWRNSLLFLIISTIREAFLDLSTGFQWALMMMIVGLFGVGAAAVLYHPPLLLIYFPLTLLVLGPTLVYLFRQAGYINQIVANTREIKSGHTPQDLPVRGRSALALLAQNINTMKKGMKQSEREQAKSERLKTELITNVSHDLRTPLTSIITYTELLKDADEQERADYIEIIDRKARRLKILIDDLFEASKMSSGNIELTLETVDVLQLLQQALAEYGEALEQSSLQLRISVPEEPLYIKADGQKIWRVFDNLIQNILKYSLEHTRVYLSVKEKKETVEIIIKNVAKYELGDNVDELLERFKRGDQSRNTEGSGLGLAIAKSIVDLHEGYLDIDVDGDLFKVIIQLPMTN